MNYIDKECLSKARFLGVRYYSTSDYVVVVQIPTNQEQLKHNKSAFRWLKVLLSAVFSFGIFRSIVFELSFRKRIRIYTSTILFWFICAILIAILTAIISKSFSLFVLALFATILMSYGAFQMLSMEYKRLNIYCYKKDASGIWIESRFDEDAILQPKGYLDYILPIRVFTRRLKFVLKLYCCRQHLDASSLDLYEKLNLDRGSVESLYALSNGSPIQLQFNESNSTEGRDVMIHKASYKDIETVAWTVLAALDMEADDLDWVKTSCADEMSMYSWNKSIVAYVDGKSVGSIISYAGDDYGKLRQYTWKNLCNDIDVEKICATDIEACSKEYYLDSMAIKQEYRGYGIGRKLIEAAIDHGRELGYKKFSLLVDVAKPRLKAYYESMGFEEVGNRMFFGRRYNRMIKNDNP